MVVQQEFPGISADLPVFQSIRMSRLINSPPALGFLAAVLAGLSAWAAGWPLSGILVNSSLAAIIATFLSKYLRNKVD